MNLLNGALLAVTVLGVFLQTVFRKNYALHVNEQMHYPVLMSGCISLSALAVFAIIRRITGASFVWHTPTVLFALGFSVCFMAAMLGGTLAVQYGSLALTSLITSYSLIIPTVFGFAVYGDKVTLLKVVGIVLLCISLFIVNPRDPTARPTKRWVLAILPAFIGNGFCSVTQTAHQQPAMFQGQYRFELLEFSMIFVVLECALVFAALCLKNRPRDLGFQTKNVIRSAIPTGVANAAVNYLVVQLASELPASLMFPVISAGGIVLTFIAAKCFYKEYFSKLQLVGYALGTLSIVVLNL